MNFSQHGQRARAVLIRRGAVDAIAVALRRLTADAHAEVLTPEGTARQTAADTEGQATKERGVTAAPSAGATIEMLLGCLANIAPHNPEEVLEAGAIDAALQVLEKADPLHTPRGEHTHPMHEAAAALIRHTAEATVPDVSGGATDAVAILTTSSHGQQLLSLSERLAAIAKQRPASASVRAPFSSLSLSLSFSLSLSLSVLFPPSHPR